MAVKTFMVAGGTDGNFSALVDGVDQTAASRSDGWTVAKLAATNMAEYDSGTKQASGSFSTAAKPASFLTGTTANAFKSPIPFFGTFAATAWTFTFAVRATTASSQAGRMRMRVFKANPDGTQATELTGATQIGTTSSALSTSADVTSVVTWSPGSTIVLGGEYLFFVLAWEVTTASGSNSGDVVIRTGQASGGSRLVTPDFAVNITFGAGAVVDNFTRADVVPPSGSWIHGIAQANGWQVISNQLTTRAGSGVYDEIYWNSSLVTDMEVFVTLATVSGVSGDALEIHARHDPLAAGETGYFVALSVGGGVTVQLFRRTSSTNTQMGSNTLTSFAAGDGVGISVAGSRITAWKRSAGVWSSLISYVDTTISTAGRPAIHGTGNAWVIDDFSGPAAAAVTPISGTDINGSTSEIGAFNAKYAPTDANSLTTETTTPKAVVSDFDPTGPEVETATAGVKLTDTDANGATIESTSVATIISLTVYEPDQVGTYAQLQSHYTSYTQLAGSFGTYSAMQAGVLPLPNLVETATVSQPIAATDASGTATESATVKVTAFVDTDSGGVVTEITTLVAKSSTVDTNGSTTETTNLTTVNQISASDANGATTETTSLVTLNQVSGTDANGSVTESVVLAGKFTSTDVNGYTETTSLQAGALVGATDSNGTTTESGALQAGSQVSAADQNGVVTEATSQTAQIPATDVDSAVTEVTSLVSKIPDADINGITTETGSLQTVNQISGTDANGVLTESTSQVAQIPATDINGITEIAVLSTQSQISGTDTNSPTIEVQALTAKFTGTDNDGAITESASLSTLNQKSDSDANSSTSEVTASVARIPINDASGVITETGSLSTLNQLSGSDNNSATTESGSIVLTGVAVDSGTSSETGTGLAKIGSADTNGVTNEAAFITNKVSDTDAGGANAPPSFSPSSITGLGIWFDASQLGLADGASVSSWPNLANAGLPGTIIGSPAPVAHAVGSLTGKPIVSFLHGQSRLVMNGTGIGTDWTLAYVARMSSSYSAFTALGRIATTDYKTGGDPNLLMGWWGGYQDVMYDNGFGAPDVKVTTTMNWKLYSADGLTAATRARLFSDGVLLSSVTTAQGWGGQFALNGITISGDDETCDCDVAEVVMYNRQLSGPERQSVEGYLRSKWIIGTVADPETASVTHVQVVGSDTNGATVESLGDMRYAVQDSNFVTDETGGIGTIKVGFDVNSPVVETASYKFAQVTADHNGVSAETVVWKVVLVPADNGAGSSIEFVQARLVDWDSNGITTEDQLQKAMGIIHSRPGRIVMRTRGETNKLDKGRIVRRTTGDIAKITGGRIVK